MSTYLFQRLLQVILIAFLSSIVVFAILQLAPGDPVSALAAPGMREKDREALAQKYGLDQPVPIQYLRWLGLVVQGDLGRSLLTNHPANELIAERFANTIKVAFLALFLNILFGVLTGIIAAIRRGSVFDVGSMALVVTSFAIPPFWLGIMLILVFSVWLKWLPAGGTGSFKHLILPSLALGISTAALTARITRSAMLEVLSADYIRTARSKGLHERRVVLTHALRNALIPVLTIIGQITGAMLAGAVITETVFAYPGIGYTLVKSLSERDFPIIQAALLVTSLTYLLINLLLDIAYFCVDPRIRFS